MRPLAPSALCLLALLTAPANAESAAERLPACLACHGESGTSANPGVPRSARCRRTTSSRSSTCSASGSGSPTR